MTEERTPTLAELNRSMAQTHRELREMGRKIGELTNGWGRFVEALVMPAIPTRFAKLGYDVYEYGPRKRREGSEEIEIDVLALARHKKRHEVVLVVEVKSHLNVAWVDWFLREKLARFAEFFPEYRDRTVEGVVAGIRIDEGVVRYAQEKGLYVLVPSGETMRIANPPRFQPRSFRAD